MATRPVTAEVALNSTKRIKATFTNAAGSPTAPSGNVNFRQIEPDGTDTGEISSGWTNPSTGVYYRDIAFDALGTWRLSAWATGADAAEYLVSVSSILSN